MFTIGFNGKTLGVLKLLTAIVSSFFLLITEHFVWETNLQPVSDVIDLWEIPGWPGEQVIALGATHLHAVQKNHIDNNHHGVICEF